MSRNNLCSGRTLLTDTNNYQRPAPPDLAAKYSQMVKERGMDASLVHVYAMLEAWDRQLGRLLAHLDATGLSENTYVMLLGDNGPEVRAAACEGCRACWAPVLHCA